MKKKLPFLLLIVTLMLTALSVTSFAQGENVDLGMGSQFEMNFSVENVSVGYDDETVDISITIDANGGFAGINYLLMYDKEGLMLETEPTLGDIEGLDFQSGPLDAADGKHLGIITSKDGKNIYDVGETLVTYTFKVNQNAKAGAYDVQFAIDGKADVASGTVSLGVMNENLEDVVTLATEVLQCWDIRCLTMLTAAAVLLTARQRAKMNIYISALQCPQETDTNSLDGQRTRMQ